MTPYYSTPTLYYTTPATIDKVTPQIEENSIIAGPSRASTVEQDRIVGGVEAKPRSWPGGSLSPTLQQATI
uniref:Uncharacterized protein n=1 Tax=Daphnia galeata TaxID=27404 RepID=A0A8J2RPV8_9CRUS|nr:unnamed protein product [Daphnia galeata]